MNRRTTAVLLITTAVTTNAAFTVLGSVFDYPDILGRPVGEILTAFRARQSAIIGWFSVLALTAAMFAPIALGVGRLSRHPAMRAAVPVGLAAAVVQVIGLSRWPLLVPGFAADAQSADPTVAAAAVRDFGTAHQLLGHVVGETFGYLFTAVWLLLVARALHGVLAGRWFTLLGAASAVLIVSGVGSAFGIAAVDRPNFVGYVLFSVWMLVFAVLLVVRRQPMSVTMAPEPAGAVRR